jgi:hypothetical protein
MNSFSKPPSKLLMNVPAIVPMKPHRTALKTPYESTFKTAQEIRKNYIKNCSRNCL